MSVRAALVAALVVCACSPEPDQQHVLDGFSWLEGCWLSRDGAVERWEAADGATMSGNNLFPQTDGAQIALTLQLEATSDGVIFSAQSPEGAAARYSLTSRSQNEALFENPDNEGPKRVGYRRDGETLVTTLSESLDPEAASYVTRYQPCANDTIAP